MTSAISSPKSNVPETPQPSLVAERAGKTVNNPISTKSTLTSLAGTEDAGKPKADKIENKVEQSKSNHDHPVYQKILAKAKEMGFTSEQLERIRCEKINGRTLIFVGTDHYSPNERPLSIWMTNFAANNDCVIFHEGAVQGEVCKNNFGLEEERLHVLCTLLLLYIHDIDTKENRTDASDLTRFETSLKYFIEDIYRDGFQSKIFQEMLNLGPQLRKLGAHLAAKLIVDLMAQATSLDAKFVSFVQALKDPKTSESFKAMMKKLATLALDKVDLDRREKGLAQLVLADPKKHSKGFEPVLLAKRDLIHTQFIAKVMKERSKAIGIVEVGDSHIPGHIRELQKLL